MPFKPDPDPDLHYSLVIGECPPHKAPDVFIRYMIASIRGTYTIDEASAFFVALMDEDEVPRYDLFFSNPRIRVHTIGMCIDPCLDRPKYRKVRYYIDHYSPVEYLSEYEWNVARHDIHEFLNPDVTEGIFGDLIVQG